jgi:photosystem II stability/assembly factor-like uncharacterized protein
MIESMDRWSITMMRAYCTRKKKKLRLALIYILLSSMMISQTSALGFIHNSVTEESAIWESLESDYPGAVYRDVAFYNATHGWVVGQWTGGSSGNGVVLYTDDGGDTWQTQLHNGSEQKYDKIDIYDWNSIWVTGYSSLYHSSDGGQTWIESNVVSSKSLMSTVKFIDEDNGWTATSSVLYKTTDGGLTWTSVPGWAVQDNPLTLNFISATEVYAIGFRGIYFSDDGAETWSIVSDIGGCSLSMVDTMEGWAVGDNILLHTVDDNDWESIPIPGRSLLPRFDPPYLSEILALEDRVWIVGDEIPIMHTSNGGDSWYEQTVPEEVNDRILALDFHNHTLGWAVGYGGVILRTNEGDTFGPILYSGSLDPLIITAMSISVGSIVVVGGILLYRKRLRKSQLVQVGSELE